MTRPPARRPRHACAAVLTAFLVLLALPVPGNAVAGATEPATPNEPAVASAPTDESAPLPETSSDSGVAKVHIPHVDDAKTDDAVVAAAVVGPPSVTVSPTTGLSPAGGSTIAVSGSGFSPTANNAFGVYVAFGPVDPATYFSDANRFLAAVWLHPGGGASGSPGQGELQANGTFTATLPPAGGLALTARYTDGNGTAVDCLTTQCYVITIAAHGVTDRSQDTCTPVSFAGGTAVAQVDRTCRPVPPGSQPAGTQSTGGNGSTTGANGGSSDAANAGPGTAGSATLPKTGSTTGPAGVTGLVVLLVGMVLMQAGRGRVHQIDPHLDRQPLDRGGEQRRHATALHVR